MVNSTDGEERERKREMDEDKNEREWQRQEPSVRIAQSRNCQDIGMRAMIERPFLKERGKHRKNERREFEIKKRKLRKEVKKERNRK